MIRNHESLAELQRLLAARDRAGLNALLAAWLDQDAKVGDRWAIFADILAQHGEWPLALRAVGHHRAASPNDPARVFTQAVMLARAGHNAQAREYAESLLRVSPRDARLNHFMGTLASEAGRFDVARDHFLRALAVIPQSPQTWLELSAIHRFTADDPLLNRLRHTVAGNVAQQYRAPLVYALGKALDDVDDVDAAFAAFAEGAALVARERPYDAAADRAEADAVMAAWDNVALPRFGDASGSARVFVTGLPRSGTTLVEHILASHPAIIGGGELNLLSMLAQEVGGIEPTALARFVDTGRSLSELPLLYDYLISQRFSPNARIVDKTLDASRMLGFVATLMPDAPIVWLRRNPLDTAWSCFHTYFARGVSWSWSQAAIASHFTQEDRLFTFWGDRLGDRLLCVDYETLVSDPEPEIRRIEAHVGLRHDDRTLKPHVTERTIATSSVAQVRRPINRQAIFASKRYRPHLTPFIEAYHGSGI